MTDTTYTKIIIDEGIIQAEDGLKYKYRCFMDMPIGMGIIYPVDKKPETLMQEMDVERENQDTVFWENTGQVLPVHKNEDGSIELPLLLVSVYMALFTKDFDMVYVSDGFEQDHEVLYEIWKKNWEQHKAKEGSI